MGTILGLDKLLEIAGPRARRGCWPTPRSVESTEGGPSEDHRSGGRREGSRDPGQSVREGSRIRCPMRSNAGRGGEEEDIAVASELNSDDVATRLQDSRYSATWNAPVASVSAPTS